MKKDFRHTRELVLRRLLPGVKLKTSASIIPASAISGNCPVSPAAEMAFFTEISRKNAGHGRGHEYGQNSRVFCITRLFADTNMDIEPDIYADI